MQEKATEEQKVAEPEVSEQNTEPEVSEQAEQPEISEESGKKEEKGNGLTLRRAAWIVFFAALVLAVVVAALLPGGSGIVLPEGSGTARDVITEQTGYSLTGADITKENVQQVIASLARPEAYVASVTNTLYWNGAWKEIQARQYVRDGVSLTAYSDAEGNTERFQAVSGDRYSAWRRGSTAQYSGSTGTVSADDIGMIPTYETVVNADPANITEDGLRTVSGVSCIFVTVSDPATNYQLTYWVSTVSGLLIQADYTRGGELIRSVVIDDIQQKIPPASLYLLPDGTSLLPQDAE